MMSDTADSLEYKTNFIKLALKLSAYMKTKEGNPLEQVRIAGGGKGYYWSMTDNKFVMVDKGGVFFLVPTVAADDMGRLCLFTPYLFVSGLLLRVPADEIELVGFN